jgi:toxin ParE1/3/4
MSITKRPQVYRDLADHASHIAQHSLAAADHFLDAAEETFHFLEKTPYAGAACQFDAPLAAGLRVWRVHGFPNHLVFYRPEDDGIDVIRVIHGARDIESIFGRG